MAGAMDPLIGGLLHEDTPRATTGLAEQRQMMSACLCACQVSRARARQHEPTCRVRGAQLWPSPRPNDPWWPHLIDSLGQPVVFLICCDAHPYMAVVDCAGLWPPRAPSCFPVM